MIRVTTIPDNPEPGAQLSEFVISEGYRYQRSTVSIQYQCIADRRYVTPKIMEISFVHQSTTEDAENTSRVYLVLNAEMSTIFGSFICAVCSKLASISWRLDAHGP